MTGRFGPAIGNAAITSGLIAVLALSTVGEGGASPTVLLIEHLLLLVLVLAKGSAKECAGRRLDPGVAYGLAGFCVAALVGALVAPYAYAAWLVLVEIASFSAVLWLAARTGPSLLPPLAFVLAGWAALQSLVAIGQRLSGSALRPGAGFLNPNDLGAWLVAVLFLSGGLALSRGRALRIAAGLAALPVAVALLLIGSRGAVVGALAGALTAGVLARGRITPAVRRRAAVALSVLLLLGLGGVALRFRIGDPHGLARPSIWRASFASFLAHPWTGTGPGQFETASANLNFPREDRPLRFERAFSTPHSDLLRAPCEFGVFATLAAAAAIFCGLRAVARRRVSLSPGETAALSALAALTAHALFNDLTETPGLYLLVAALAGACVSAPDERQDDTTLRNSRTVHAAILVVAIAIFAVGDLAPYLSWRAVRGLPRGVLTESGRDDLSRAIAYNPVQPDLYLRRVQDRLARSPRLSLSDYVAAREDAERAIRLNPASSAAFVALAHVEGSGCRDLFGDVATRRRALTAFDAAQERARHDPLLSIDAARFLLATGDPQGARREAEQALRIEPNAVLPRLLIVEALLLLGDPAMQTVAARHLDEAEAIAARYSAETAEGAYAAQLLTLDPRVRDGLRKAIVSWPRPALLDAPLGRD